MIEETSVDICNKNNETETESCSASEKGYPKQIGFILGNQLCEAFSVDGMQSILFLYLRNYLKFNDKDSVMIYHIFTILAFLSPLFGGIIADCFWGKYKTIKIFSTFYIAGYGLQLIGSIPYILNYSVNRYLSVIGLVSVAVGIGGIEPCVTTFASDQFTEKQRFLRKKYFSLSYFAYNAVSIICFLIFPILRNIECYGKEESSEECFTIAFAVSLVFMVISFALFVAGSRWYISHHPSKNIFLQMCKCIFSAIKTRWNTPKSERTKIHWIEYSNSSEKMKRDTKYVLQIILLFLPIPIFWTLFNQQGSTWLLQATRLDMRLGSIDIKPDQIEVLNPLLVLILIPLMEFTLYPLLEYFKINFSDLRKMTIGFLLTGVSFVVAAALQMSIDKTQIILPTNSQFGVRFINSAPCNLNITFQDQLPIFIEKTLASEINFFPKDTKIPFSFSSCSGKQINDEVTAGSGIVKDIFLHGAEAQEKVEVNMLTEKSENGRPRLTILNLATNQKDLTFTSKDVETEVLPYQTRTRYPEVDRGNIVVKILDGVDELYEIGMNMEACAVYTLVITDSKDKSFFILDLNPNVISVAWIIPQFMIISIGEVFLAITGLEFSYSQAPPSMKSVLASIWLLTVSFGNIIVLIVTEARRIEKQSDRFLLFAGLIFLAAIIFAFLAYRYKLVDEDEFAEEIEEENRKRLGIENVGFDTNDEKQTTKM